MIRRALKNSPFVMLPVTAVRVRPHLKRRRRSSSLSAPEDRVAKQIRKQDDAAAENQTEAVKSQRAGFVAGLAVGIVIIAAVIYFVRKPEAPEPQVQQVPAPAIAQPAPAAVEPSFTAAEIEAAPRIDAAEAKRLLDRGEAVAVDVRTAQDYMAGHIPGALQIPLEYVGGELPYFPRDKKLITYCT